MENVIYKTNGTELTINLKGRVDGSNASLVEADIFANLDSITSLVLDLEGLDYISSAGLRVILKLLKRFPDLKAINASAEVYDILEMTGFTEMMKVVKAYKTLSIEGCEVIGVGANGKVYRIDNETIVKTYLNPESLGDIHRERELARHAFVLGIPTAISYDVVKVGSGYGSVFELLNARSFAKLFAQDQDNFDLYVKLYVDLLKTIHSKVVEDDSLPKIKDTAINWVKYLEKHLEKEDYDKLYRLVDEVSDDNTVLHGDYHIKNVMMQNDEVLLIDMDTLCKGNIIFEFGSIYNAYIGFNLPLDEDNFFLGLSRADCKKLFDKLMPAYFNDKSKEELDQIILKSSLVGMLRAYRRSLKRGDPNNPQDVKAQQVFRATLLDALHKVNDLKI